MSSGLQLKRICKHFGGVTAAQDIDLAAQPGELVGLIGPNGAGKSTILNMITGFCKSDSGNIHFLGKDITNLKSHAIARSGVVRTFQQTSLFDQMTVLENVLVGCHLHSRLLPSEFLKTSRGMLTNGSFYARAEMDKARQVLEETGLAAYSDRLANGLPLGHKRQLGIAVAMAASPEALLLDEPLTGMNWEESQAVLRTLREFTSRGKVVLLVEHNMRAIRAACDRTVVVSFGRKIAEGCPKEVCQDPMVIEAYLGADNGC